MNLPKIFTRDGSFYDGDGRQVILHGINLVNKDPKVGHIGLEDETTFKEFRGWGFNCVRLGVFWDSLEPQPGKYNEAYLRGIRRQLDWAHDNDIYVFLDMHQDLYSVLYADGAPEWATLHEGQPHIGGEIWSDAYFASPAVQTALDNFWRNAPILGEDKEHNLGLQDHFAACWRLLADRFGQHPAVIGYDIFNEPVPGEASPLAMAALFGQGAELLAQVGIEIPSSNMDGDPDLKETDPADNLMAQWLTPEGRFQILHVLSDPQIYAAVIDAAQPIYNQFEKELLLPFYHRVANAIRPVDPHGILFVETSMGSNMGLFSAVEPLTHEGERDYQQAYAPHGYDLVVDTPSIALASSERVGVIFNRHGETARKHNWPMLIGEWGAYGLWDGTLPAAQAVVGLFENLRCSDTYWAYEPSIDQADCFPALNRPYPERVAGHLDSYHSQPETGEFTCVWTEDPQIDCPTIIYLPGWLEFDPANMTLTPSGEYRIERSSSGGVWLYIRPLPNSPQRTLTIA